MGVDYNAPFGVGFDVVVNDDALETEGMEGDQLSYLDEFVDGNMKVPYVSLESGNCYEGDSTYHVIIQNFFDRQRNFQEEADELEKFLDDLGISVTSDFGLVGGLLID